MYLRHFEFIYHLFRFQLEINDENEAMSKGSEAVGGCTSTSKAASERLADELDNLMDISIEIASNKRMKKDYIKAVKLTFKDKDMEKKVNLIMNIIIILCDHSFLFPVLPSKRLHL